MAASISTGITTEAADCISCYREEILIYLVQRFGSLGFAQRVFAETQRRLDDCEVLNYVPNPHIYLIGYVLSLGLEFMQADMEESRRVLRAKALASAGDTATETYIPHGSMMATFHKEAATAIPLNLNSQDCKSWPHNLLPTTNKL